MLIFKVVKSRVAKQEKYPVLPLRDIVVYPKMIVPLFVGREKSINALQEVVDAGGSEHYPYHPKNAAIEDPTSNDVYHVGTIGTVLQLLRLPDGTVKVLIEGLGGLKSTGFTHQILYGSKRNHSAGDRKQQSGAGSFGSRRFVAV